MKHVKWRHNEEVVLHVRNSWKSSAFSLVLRIKLCGPCCHIYPEPLRKWRANGTPLTLYRWSDGVLSEHLKGFYTFVPIFRCTELWSVLLAFRRYWVLILVGTGCPVSMSWHLMSPLRSPFLFNRSTLHNDSVRRTVNRLRDHKINTEILSTYHAIKTYGVEWSASRSGRFTPRGYCFRYPLITRLGGPHNGLGKGENIRRTKVVFS
jgi:hypothetical protein